MRVQGRFHRSHWCVHELECKNEGKQEVVIRSECDVYELSGEVDKKS